MLKKIILSGVGIVLLGSAVVVGINKNGDSLSNPLTSVSRGGGFVCIATSTMGAGTLKTTTYYSGRSSRMDQVFTGIHAGIKSYDSHAITIGDSNGTVMYTWSSHVQIGQKAVLSTVIPEGTYAAMGNNPDCVPWTVDSSLFVVPSTIEFN